MDDQVCTTLASAIEQALPIAQELALKLTEPFLVWRRTGDRQWSGSWEHRPCLMAVFSEADKAFAQISEPFNDIFLQKYPRYSGMVGFSNLGATRLFSDRSYFFRNVLADIYRRHGSFEGGCEVIDATVRSVSRFVDGPTIRLRFAAQLLNFYTPAEKIELPKGLSIRRLDDQEVTNIYGGPIHWRGFSSHRAASPHDFVIEGDFQEKLVFDDQAADVQSEYNQVRPRLDRAMLALRTFKEGRVGYEFIRFQCDSFCPLAVGEIGFGDLHVPWGSYELAPEEMEPLQNHAEQIANLDEAAMEMACFRLSDAQMRLRPEDRIVDAVIGLEALLLAGLNKDDRRGELKYRFSMNYASLVDGPNDRLSAFRTAKDLYDLRSTVAHGGTLKPDGCRVGAEKLVIEEASKLACNALRSVISYFLQGKMPAIYKNPQFWESRYFGLE